MAEKIDFVNPYDSVHAAQLQAAREKVAALEARGLLRKGPAPAGVERSHPELANNGGVGIQLTPTKETPSAALLREQLDKSIAGITKPNPYSPNSSSFTVFHPSGGLALSSLLTLGLYLYKLLMFNLSNYA